MLASLSNVAVPLKAMASVRAYASIGSNLEPERNIRDCIRLLKETFSPLTCSPVYRNPAVGFVGDDFYNLVVGFDTECPFSDLKDLFRRFEQAQGRQRGGPKFSARTLDLDLLTYGDLVMDLPGGVLPHPDILAYPFVLQPLADIAPDEYHPRVGKTYAELWRSQTPTSAPMAVLADFRNTL